MNGNIRSVVHNCLGFSFLMFVGLISFIFDDEKTVKFDDKYAFIILLIFAPLSFIGGIGVMRLKKWGYWPAKISMFLFLVFFPIGTYFGVKSLKSLNELKDVLE